MRPCCPSDWTACSPFMSLFRWKHCAFPTTCPLVSRGKHDVPAWFGTGGAVPPSRVLPFSKAKRSGYRFMWGSPPSKMGDDALSQEERPPLSPFSLFQRLFYVGGRPFHVGVRMEPRYCSFCVLFWENRREDFVNYDITYYFYNIFFDYSMDGEKICLCVSFVKNTVSVLRISVIIS